MNPGHLAARFLRTFAVLAAGALVVVILAILAIGADVGPPSIAPAVSPSAWPTGP